MSDTLDHVIKCAKHTNVVITVDTEHDLFGVRDDLEPGYNDVSYFDILDAYPSDWIWVLLAVVVMCVVYICIHIKPKTGICHISYFGCVLRSHPLSSECLPAYGRGTGSCPDVD